MSLSRRSFLTMLGAAAVANPASALPIFKSEAVPFSVNWFKGEAKRLAGEAFAPMAEVPEAWKSYSFKINYRGQILTIEVTQGGTHFSIDQGNDLEILVDGKAVVLSEHRTVIV